MGEYLVWLDESFFYAGEGERSSVVSRKDGHFAEKGDYERLGLLDALLMYWEPSPPGATDEERDYFERAGADPTIWFVKDGHYFGCKKLNDTIRVWLAQKQKEKQDVVPAQAEQAGPGGDRLGTMNYKNITNWWFIDRLLLFKAVLQADGLSNLEAYMKAGREELTAAEGEDLNRLKSLVGRQACFVMDGAMYHKGANPYYVQREGTGGLYGAGGKGRHDPANGWKHDQCIYALFLHQFRNKNAETAFNWLTEPKELAAHKEDYVFAKWLYKQDIIFLRDLIDQLEFASDKKMNFLRCVLSMGWSCIGRRHMLANTSIQLRSFGRSSNAGRGASALPRGKATRTSRRN